MHEFEIAGEIYGIPTHRRVAPPVDSEARKPLIKTLYGEKMFAVDADAELTQVLTQDCPTSKSKQIQQRKWFARNRLGQ